MANGYIGKISAVVTANTSDLSAKLRGSVQDVNKFANALNSSISAASRSATQSLERIFTPLQQFERKLQTALQLNIRTDKEVAQLQALKSVVEGINSPLEGAARQFAGLSSEIAAGFLPALKSTQDKVLLVNRAVSETGSVSARSFGIAEASVQRATQAIQRLSEAQQLVRSGFSGRELQFTAPRVFEVLQPSAGQRSMANLPARALDDGVIAREAQKVKQLENYVAQVQAEVEAIKIKPQVDTAALDAGERRLNQAIETARRAKQAFDELVESRSAGLDFVSRQGDAAGTFGPSGPPRGFTSSAAVDRGSGLGLFGSQAGTETERAIARARDVSAAYAKLPEAARAGLSGLASIASRVANGVEAGTANARQLEQVLDRLESKIDKVSSLSLPVLTDPPEVLANTKIGASSRFDAVDVVRKDIENTKNVIKSIGDAPLAGTLGPYLDKLTIGFNALTREAKLTADQIAKVNTISREVNLTRAALQERRDSAKAFLSTGGSAGLAGLDLRIDQKSLQGYAAQVDLIQGKLTRFSQEARGPAVAALEVYRRAVARAFSDGSISTEEGQKKIQRYRAEVVRLTSQLTNVSTAKLGRELNRVGDIARGSFSNVGLAVQQVIFAFDDFASVTGGLDQRIRAAGNNISQLGFILGGTFGLFAGVAVSVIAQIAVGFVRWYTEAEKAEAATKRLNSALDGQRSKTEELAKSYRDLADAIALSGLSGRQRQDAERRQRVRGVEQQQEARQRDVIAANSPILGLFSKAIEDIDKKLESEANIVARQRLLESRARFKEAEDIEIARITQRGIELANVAVRAQGPNAIQDLRTGFLGVRDVRSQLARAQSAGDAASAAILTRQLASLEVAIRILNDRNVLGALDRQQQVADTLQRGERRIQDIGGNTLASLLQQQATEAARQGVLNAEGADETAVARLSELVQQTADAFERTAIQVGSFAKTLDAAAGQIARAAENDLAERAVSLRREANAAEARFGAADERTTLLRAQQEEVEASRRRASADRAGVDAQISQRRLEFERNAIFDAVTNLPVGLGDPRAAAIARQIAELERVVAAPATTRQEVIAQESARLQIGVLEQQLQAVFESLPDTQALRRRADEIDVAAQRRIQESARAEEGRQLTMTPAERAAEEFADRVFKIREYANKAAENSSGLPRDVEKIRGEANRAVARLSDETFRQTAPAIFGFADNVANALLQGPSRAALNVTDVSTVEGARELNRLLRGDDPARDQNLIELQKQSQSLEELVRQGRERGVIPVANQ